MRIFLSVLCGVAGWAVLDSPLQAQGLAPQTRIRLDIVQWMPMTGQYERWDALSGELVVSPDGTVTVPLLGAVPVGQSDATALAVDVASQLQARMGLVDPPNATIEVLEYPPIYVVGAVATPGEYTFRPGMTVLQALALGGGQLREEAPDGAGDRIQLLARLEINAGQTQRTTMLIARLQAEYAGAAEIEFPEGDDSAVFAASRNQEQAVFAARNRAEDRQASSLGGLNTLYQREIEVLNVRVADLESAIEAAEGELSGVEQLVESGVATIARRSELRRSLADLRADRLDQLTAIMRANQYLTETDRNLASIEDERSTEVAQQLQTAQGTLEELQLQAQTDRALLANLDRQLLSGSASGEETAASLVYAIVRPASGGVEELPAEETTRLQPGDVVKVLIASATGAAEQNADGAAENGDVGAQ